MLLFLYGPDTYRLTQKLHQIEERYAQVHGSGLNLEKIEAQTAGFKDFWDNLNQQSLFIEKKLFILNNLFLSDQFKKQFIKKIKELSASSQIIVLLEKGQPKKSNSLFKALLKSAQAQEFPLLTGQKLIHWLKKELASYGAQIDRFALQKLALQAKDPWQLAQLVKQLAAYTKNITPAHVDLFLKGKQPAEIFKTIDELAAGYKKRALQMLEDHFRAGDSPFYLLSMFAYQFRNLLLVKSAQGDYQQLSQLKLHPYVLKKTIVLANRFTFDQLKAIFQEILQADLAVKTGQLDPAKASACWPLRFNPSDRDGLMLFHLFFCLKTLTVIYC